jgi:hypothetical protein
MTIFQYADAIKQHILKQVEAFSLEKGISFPKDSLTKNISLSREDIESIVNPSPKKKKNEKKVQFNIKPKKKFNIKPTKQTDYNLFVSICDQHGQEYFEFTDENEWCGPALKVNDSEYDIVVEYFNSIEVVSVSGTDFYIIHPKKKCINNIIYKDEPIESCKIEPKSLMIPTSDDEADDEVDDEVDDEANAEANIYDNTTDDEAEESCEELELEEWTHENTHIKYLLDISTNNLYSVQTTELIGKKIDEFTIEFN